jgi:hypothetical protein
MDTLNQTVNGKALNDTLNLMFGPELTAVVGKLYFALDASMKAGYELGLQTGQENLEAACDASFDTGYEHGEKDGLLQGEGVSSAAISEAYDDGYLHGVGDARSQPHLADEVVQDIINVRAEAHFEALAEDYDFDPSEYTVVDEDGYTVGN